MALFSSSTLTLIYSDETRLVRCDVDVRKPRVLSLRVWPRSRDGELPEMVEYALAQESRRPSKVYVLSSELWSQKVSVANSTVDGLSVPETSRALAFEAESFSGISAFDSLVSYVSLGKQDGLHAFWVTQISVATRTRLEKNVQERGGRLLGILHPAGLPASLLNSASAWNRVENWPGLMLGVNNANGMVQYRIINPERRGQTTEAILWQEALSPAPNVTLPAAAITNRLQSNEELSDWLLKWALCLSHGQAATPLIKSEPKPLSKNVYVAAAVFFAAIAGGVVAYDRDVLLKNIAANEQETARLKDEAEQLAKLTKDREATQKQLQTLTSANSQLSAAINEMNASLSAQHQRWRDLMHILALHSSDAMVIQEITVNGGVIEIRGKCLGQDAAHEFATEIAAKVRPLGWSLVPSQKAIAANELYNFVWQLAEVPLPVRPPAVPLNIAERVKKSPDKEPDTELVAPNFISSEPSVSNELPGGTP